eukprot:TRINITY_DN49089_c0_g1_i1.p1 TRINITY_DN49089_c0_g1~~TRINITY_DN49089_c0_g1_i1.p1  ORF type:complete len:858 (-),score=166.77 TRINITY_DN49089_c0_g1_i1:518-2824(-)
MRAATRALHNALAHCPYDPALRLVAEAVLADSSPPSQPSTVSAPTPVPTTSDASALPSESVMVERAHALHEALPNGTPSAPSSPTHSLQRAMSDAADAHQMAEYSRAIQHYSLVIDAQPPPPTALLTCALVGRSEAHLSDAILTDRPQSFDAAIADASAAVQLQRTSEHAWYTLGNAHLQNAHPARAKSIFERALQFCPRAQSLLDGVRDAQFVIDEEGAESDSETPPTVPTSNHSPPPSQEAVATSPPPTSASNPLQTPSRSERSFSLLSQRNRHDVFRSDADSRSLSSRFRFSRHDARSSSSERSAHNPTQEPASFSRLAASLSSYDKRTSSMASPPTFTKSNSFASASASASASTRAETNASNDASNTAPTDASSSSFSAHSRKELYELLQVPRDATEAMIKKSYYQLARKYHPDKNAGDQHATYKFQKLAEAYRVLSDPESRAVYDRYGDRGLVKNSVNNIDPSTLFAMVFGSDQFVNLIGELQLASLATNVDDGGNTPSEEVLNSIQRARVGKLVLEMIKMLKPWVDGDKKGFLENTNHLMHKLRDASFGPHLLETVGKVYVQHTTHLLDKNRPFNLSAVMRKASVRSHKFASHHKALNAANRVMDKQKKLHDRVMRSGRDQKFISEGEAKKIAVEMAENAIDMMWKISIIDIETTLEDVLLIVLSGRDLVAESDMFSPPLSSSDSTSSSKPKHRRRIGSYLSRDGRERNDRVRDRDRLESQLVRPLPPLSHGEAAATRQQVLSERAHGIQTMGRIFLMAQIR